MDAMLWYGSGTFATGTEVSGRVTLPAQESTAIAVQILTLRLSLLSLFIASSHETR
jgi:hypothetical protein